MGRGRRGDGPGHSHGAIIIILVDVPFGSYHHIVASFCSRHVSAPENRINEGFWQLISVLPPIDIYAMSTCATNTMQPVHDGLSQVPTISRNAAPRLAAAAATPISSFDIPASPFILEHSHAHGDLRQTAGVATCCRLRTGHRVQVFPYPLLLRKLRILSPNIAGAA